MARKDVVCESCQTDFSYYPGNSTGRFCTNQCRADWQYHSYIERWLDGKETGNQNDGRRSNHVRRWLFEKYDSKCQHCGWREVSEWTGLIPLQVNHIDGDWQNTIPTNIELCCPNCHSLTEFHGSLNKGRGRYSKGKLHPKHRNAGD